MNALHPTLRSLWNIPHVIRIPDPMPALPDLIQCIELRIADWTADKKSLDPAVPDDVERIAVHNCNIAILEHKLEEIRRAFPEFGVRREAPLSLSAPDAPAQRASADESLGLTTVTEKIQTETTETDVQPQQHPAETEVRSTETQPRQTETEPIPTEPVSLPADTDPAASADAPSDKSFEAAL